MLGSSFIQKRIIIITLLLMLVVLAITLWMRHYYFPLMILMLILSMVPFFCRFEKKEVNAEEIVIIAVLAAIAAVSRIPFSALPSVQPSSFVIIASGLVFGPQVGFMVGTTSALASNFFLGQGPWTLFQMFAWGIMGLTAGLLQNTRWMDHLLGQSVFGFTWGFIFGWFMNLWFILVLFESITWEFFLGAYAASFYFDLAHALSNVFFITLFLGQWQKILGRIKIKYGILH